MKYPQPWKKLIDTLGITSGFLIIIVAVMSVAEAILRYFFTNPTGWVLNICQYLLVFMVFLSSPYAFQEGGHVAVDMILNLADRYDRTGKRISRRVLTVFGYTLAAIFVGVLAYGSASLLIAAVEKNRMTSQIPVIPLWILYVPMVIGCLLMLITLLLMIVDCLNTSSEGKYL